MASLAVKKAQKYLITKSDAFQQFPPHKEKKKHPISGTTGIKAICKRDFLLPNYWHCPALQATFTSPQCPDESQQAAKEQTFLKKKFFVQP